MAWKDPFETLVDSTVVDFAAFLSHQANLAPNEEARTLEVCRDFCVYLCKDVHKASPQDYAIYLQLHAMTAEAETDYHRMLGYIRAFAQERGQNHEQAPAQKPQSSARLSRKNVGTLQFEPSKELLDDLNNPQMSSNAHAANPHNFAGFDRHNNAPTPERALPAQLEAGFDLNSIDRHRKPSISEGLGQFDFSIDEGLMGPIFDEPNTEERSFKTPQERAISSGEHFQTARSSTIDAFEKVASDDISFPNPSYDKSIFSPETFRLEGDPMPSGILRPNLAISQYNTHQQASLKAVDNVSYVAQDFEQMRKLGAQDSHIPAAQGSQNLGFKPYTFGGRYTINCPLPNPQHYQPVPRGLLQSFVYPLAPTIIALALAAAAATISLSIAVVILLIAVILIAIAIPDLVKPAQQTPHASIASYLSALRGRCYNIGPALIAKKHNDECPDLHDLWEDKVPSPLEALKQRFIRHPLPDIQNVAGSDKQNALVLLFETPQAYHVVPLIRTAGKWYICDPELGRQKLDIGE